MHSLLDGEVPGAFEDQNVQLVIAEVSLLSS